MRWERAADPLGKNNLLFQVALGALHPLLATHHTVPGLSFQQSTSAAHLVSPMIRVFVLACHSGLKPSDRADHSLRWKTSKSREAAPRPLAPRSLQEMPVECGSLAKSTARLNQAWICSAERRSSRAAGLASGPQL